MGHVESDWGPTLCQALQPGLQKSLFRIHAMTMRRAPPASSMAFLDFLLQTWA